MSNPSSYTTLAVGSKVFQALNKLCTSDNPQDLDNTTWTAIAEAQAIWEPLISQGKEHFFQASDTPFLSGPIANLIGLFKFNNYSEQILDGTFDTDLITQWPLPFQRKHILCRREPRV